MLREKDLTRKGCHQVQESQPSDMKFSQVMAAIAAVFLMAPGSTMAQKTFPLDCGAVGGTMKDGVCYIEDWSRKSGKNGVNEEWLLTAGDMSISGIDYVSYGSNEGIIANAGTGTLTITGEDARYKHGIDSNGDIDGNSGSILNTGKGKLIITGGSGEIATGLFQNSGFGGIATVSNTNSGELIISGGIGAGAAGIAANSMHPESTGTISNTSSGTLTIRGGAGEGANGIAENATLGNGLIINSGSGTLTISGGSGENSSGLEMNSSSGIGVISNSGSGTLTIQGGTKKSAHGINYNAYTSGSGTISNGPEGTLNILGNKASGSYGIATLSFGLNSKSYLENAGVMNINKIGIGTFSEKLGNVLISNASTGTVNAEVEAIFTKTQSTDSTDSEIAMTNPSDGVNSKTEVDGFNSGGSEIAWNVKNDWAQYSKWEDGGVLNITDVVDGSLAAQQIQTAFTSLFGSGTDVNFLGEDDWASEGLISSSSTDAFTSSIGNALIDQGYAGNIVTNFNLNNASSDGTAQALTVGTGSGEVIKDSIGFRKVEGVSSLTVNSGKYFALIGQPAGGELIEGGAPVTLDNGTLMLGVSGVETARADSSTAGTLETITMKNGSHVDTDNMWVQAESIEGEGSVSLTETGRMHVKELTIAGDIKNQGTLSADSLTISKGEATSSKTLKSSGKLTVESTASLSADGILAADSFDIKGVVKLGKNAEVYTGAAAMEDIRKDHADAAAELDRVEGKAEVSTMSVLDRIVAESMKASGEADKPDQEEGAVGAEPAVASLSDEDDAPVIVTSSSKSTKVMPAQAQAFAAFDAVNRIASDIEAGATPDQHGLWVKLQTNEGRFGVVKGGSSFDVDTDGAIVGAEANGMPGVKFGTALSYLDGEIEARHMKNNWESWGLHLYGAYQADAFALKGSAGWLRGTTEASKDLDADVWHAGLRAEYAVSMDTMTVTPFMGARVMSGSFDELDSQTVFSIPLGARISGEINAAGWKLTPAIEAAYVRSMGDTDAETTDADLRFLPKDALRGSIGLKAEKGMWSGELSYVGATGSNNYRSNSLNVKVGLQF